MSPIPCTCAALCWPLVPSLIVTLLRLHREGGAASKCHIVTAPCGVQVHVLEAHDIPKMDQMGKSDPSVTLFTDPKHKVSTKTVKNTLTPKWESDNEFFLMVQVQLTWSCVSLQQIWRPGTRRCMRHAL